MTGPKLNEKSFVAGERSGTKATARYVRSSAYKARAVLDLIRGLDVRRADEVLQFTDRHIARDVRKVLASAVANAVNNDDQDADELFVVACFADEGPTLQAVPSPCPWPCDPHQQAQLPHHGDRRPHERRPHRDHPGPPGARRWQRRPWPPAVEPASRRARVERSRQQAADDDRREVVDEPTRPTRRSSTTRSSRRRPRGTDAEDRRRRPPT
jgi:ribosomal protein L22